MLSVNGPCPGTLQDGILNIPTKRKWRPTIKPYNSLKHETLIPKLVKFSTDQAP